MYGCSCCVCLWLYALSFKTPAMQHAWPLADAQSGASSTPCNYPSTSHLSCRLSPCCLLPAAPQGFLEAPNGEVPSGSWLFSDVRDVASAHILAATQPQASGRYVVSQPQSLSARNITDLLKVSEHHWQWRGVSQVCVGVQLSGLKAVRVLDGMNGKAGRLQEGAKAGGFGSGSADSAGAFHPL